MSGIEQPENKIVIRAVPLEIVGGGGGSRDVGGQDPP